MFDVGFGGQNLAERRKIVWRDKRRHTILNLTLASCSKIYLFTLNNSTMLFYYNFVRGLSLLSIFFINLRECSKIINDDALELALER